MKLEKKRVGEATTVELSNSTAVVKKITSYQNSVMLLLLPLFSMIMTILLGMIRRDSFVEIGKIGILTLILTMVITFYIRWNGARFPLKKYAKSVIVFSYLISIPMIILIDRPEIFSFWMLGGLLVSMLVDNRLGLMIHFNLTFIMGLAFTLRPEIVIHLLVIGALMNLLSGPLKHKSTIIYGAIIVLSTNITLAFAVNNFIFEVTSNYNYMNSLFSVLAVLIVAFLLNSLLDRIMINLSDIEEDRVDTEERILSIADLTATALAMENNSNREFMDRENEVPDVMSVQQHLGTRTSYEILCDTNNDLLRKLKEHSEDLFKHSVRIGELSCLAAREIGANILLAKSGGFYHEIGKIKSNNYIEEGLKIAEEYAFPKELKSVLKQHNIKYDKPSSVEAAIVMLSDNIESTIEYIEKTEDRKYTTDKIIDNIFQLRMEKGTLDNSGLSVKDYKKLKEFYQKEFSQRLK